MEMTSGALEIEVTVIAEQLRQCTGTAQQSFKNRVTVHGMAETGWRLPEGLSESKLESHRKTWMFALVEGLVGRVVRQSWSATFVGVLNDVSVMSRLTPKEGVERFLKDLVLCMRNLPSETPNELVATDRESLVHGCVSMFKQTTPFLKATFTLASAHGLLTTELVHELRDAALTNYAEGGFSPEAGLPHATEFMALVHEGLMHARLASAPSAEPCSTPRQRRAHI